MTFLSSDEKLYVQFKYVLSIFFLETNKKIVFKTVCNQNAYIPSNLSLIPLI